MPGIETVQHDVDDEHDDGPEDWYDDGPDPAAGYEHDEPSCFHCMDRRLVDAPRWWLVKNRPCPSCVGGAFSRLVGPYLGGAIPLFHARRQVATFDGATYTVGVTVARRGFSFVFDTPTVPRDVRRARAQALERIRAHWGPEYDQEPPF
jgi:hypothetical protein